MENPNRTRASRRLLRENHGTTGRYPVPSRTWHARDTKLFGRAVKVFAVGAIDRNAASGGRSGTVNSIGGRPFASLILVFAPQPGATNSAPPQIKTDVTDELQRRVSAASLRPDFGPTGGTDNWRLDIMDPMIRGMVLDLPPGLAPLRREIKSINITLSLPEQRTFE